MWLAGLLMSISDGCGELPPSDLVELFRPSDDQRTAWPALPRALPRALARQRRTADFSDFGAVAIGLVVIAIVLAALVFGLALFALHCFDADRLHPLAREHPRAR